MRGSRIVRATLNEQAYDRIKEGILRGDFAQDTLYSEQYFADYLSISRTPIRDAVLRLKREHYLQVYPNRGVMIKRISEKDVNEVSQLRTAIDAYCSAYLAEHIDTPAGRAAFARIREINEREKRMLAEWQDPGDHTRDVDFIALDLQFHQHIVEFTGNSRLIELNAEHHAYINLLGVEVVKIDNRKQESVEENQAILRAIEQGDASAAYLAAKQHVEAIRVRLLRML